MRHREKIVGNKKGIMSALSGGSGRKTGNDKSDESIRGVNQHSQFSRARFKFPVISSGH